MPELVACETAAVQTLRHFTVSGVAILAPEPMGACVGMTVIKSPSAACCQPARLFGMECPDWVELGGLGGGVPAKDNTGNKADAHRQ